MVEHEPREYLRCQPEMLGDPSADDLAAVVGQLRHDLIPAQLAPVALGEARPRAADFAGGVLKKGGNG